MQQIVAASNKIASLDDVMSSVEIWRKSQAITVLKIFQETFGDVDVGGDILDCAEDDFKGIKELHEDWEELQDSCYLNSTTSSMLLDEESEYVSGISRIHNVSQLVAPITENINISSEILSICHNCFLPWVPEPIIKLFRMFCFLKIW